MTSLSSGVIPGRVEDANPESGDDTASTYRESEDNFEIPGPLVALAARNNPESDCGGDFHIDVENSDSLAISTA